MFLFASSSFAEVPVNPHFTPMSLMPRPFAASSTFDVAGIYWLPDYLGKNISRGSSEDVGGGDIEGNCEENYGMHTPSSIDDKYTCSKYNYNVTYSLKCHVNCRCKDEYKYTYSNCSGEYQPSGGSCDGKYNACSPKPCTSGGYYAEQQTDRICSAVTYGGRTCYSCYQPQCSAGGYETSTKSGYRCSTVAYYGRTCYSCKNDTCPSGYGKSSCGSAYHQTGTAKTEAGSTCYACAAHSYSCPNGTQASSSGMITPVAVSKTCSCGAASGTCYKAPAHTHSYSCPSGYQASSCSSSQTQTGTTSKVCSCGATSGTCYKCKAKTCTNTCFYTLRSCPANGYCKSCQIIGSDCSVASGGTRYSLVSCHNGTYISTSGNSCVSSCGITRCQDLCVRSGKRLDECQRTCNLNPCSYS